MFKFITLEVVHWDYWERFSLPLDADVITVVGPNGSGKTTLLDALRTLLCIDCSSGRDYKRYVRRNDKPISWLRAVVGNDRLNSGLRPFFPLLSETVTLACQIRKKGGDWQRQYLVAEGDVPLERMEEHGAWVGVRDYRQRLENAGFSQAIRHVLSLEQGDTDKLCEYSSRQLLELVFSVFGDQEVLDNYQQAKNEQHEIGRELEKLEEELAHLGVRLREAELGVNSYLEWQRLTSDIQKLAIEIVPRVELAYLSERISANSSQLRRKRRDVHSLRREFALQRSRLEQLAAAGSAALTGERELEVERRAAQERFTGYRDSARDAERILDEKNSLEEQCRLQQEGIDAPALAAEQRAQSERLAAGNHELKGVRHQVRELKATLAALKAGAQLEPGFVLEFRKQLDDAGIGHRLLTDIVEVTDPQWQKALEGVMGAYAHLVLLTDPAQRQRAWELGERYRYRNFVVGERGTPSEGIAGSLREVVRFTEPPPEWLAELLNQVRRVETVAEGSALPATVSWVTREGYYRERRGGRYIGVEPGKFLFGESARKNRIAGLERELAHLAQREEELVRETATAAQRVDEIAALLAGIDAARQLAARSAEFARIEREFPLFTQQAQDAATALAACEESLSRARDQRLVIEKEKSGLEGELRVEEASLRREEVEYQALRRQQADRITDFRTRRNPMPRSWRTREALSGLRREYESVEAARRELERLKVKEIQGSWEKNEQCLGVKEKLQGDYSHLEETIKVRRIHHHRHLAATEQARESYINVLRATVRRYSRNVRTLGDLAGIGIDLEPPQLVNDDLALVQAGLIVKFDFDRKGPIGLNDGEASGGQQVMKSLILLIGLLMDENRSGGFVFIDEPFAHLDVFNIDKVGAFLEATRAQYVLTTPNTHNVNVFKTSDLTLVTQKRRHPDRWAPPVAFLRKEKPGKKR